MKSTVASCLLLFVAATHAQWLNNYGYGLNAAGFVGGYYPANAIHSAYTGFPATADPFYGLAYPGYWPTNAYYSAAVLPTYDFAGNQVGGYAQVQDTPEVAQAKAAHFAAHAAAKAHLMKPVVTADVVAKPEVVEKSVETVPVATPISRKKRQIQHISPFAYGFPSYPMAYSNLAAHPGYNYGAPFGYHFAHPYYGTQVYPVVPNVMAPAAASPDATTSTVTDVAPTVAKTA
ncbi:uncharacterized protein LOC130702910 [Daphnia carinata]|uniref:uncharacterized protein LOC130702910 n=1 Tax=Daphnia carinata TaxID=120202 RepID=UPI00257BE544|nr:uncharacterized protein LOC130702910 [Daphnia carinata]